MTGDKLRSPMDPLNIFKQWWGEPLSEELYKRTITAPIEQQYEFLEFAENAPTADIPDLERGMLRPLLINDGFNFVDLDDYFSAASTLALYTDEVAIEYTFGAGPLDLKIMLQYLLKIKPLAEDGAVRFFKAHLHMHTESEAYKTWEQFQDVCVLAIALAIVASWVGHWVFFEPVAVGLMALALGAICVPGLRLFTKPFTYPNVNGAALLFATGSSDQALSLDVTVLPPDQEKFTINNTQGHRQTHWVLLITGDAQLHSRTAPRSVYHDDTYKNTQLFWGIINPKSDITVSGIARRDFHLTTHARAAVSFPEYGEGHLDQIHPDMRPIILERLSGKLAARQDNFTVNVRAGRLGPFLSVTQSTPELVQGAMAEYRLAWTGHDDISITFSLTNQAGVDDTNNALFVFAVLLGVAGACLIESLLGAIKRTAKTKASK